MGSFAWLWGAGPSFVSVADAQVAPASPPVTASPVSAPPSTPTSPPPSTPAPADREAAQKAFGDGQHAFRSGDFRHAAEAFEVAYFHAPHPDVLWNAARAWHRARELARAANLYSRFLQDAPADARDRNSATAELRELAAKVARIDVVAPGCQDVQVDGLPLEGPGGIGGGGGTVYLTPGAHVVEGKLDGRPLRQTPTVAAGDVVSVALVEGGTSSTANGGSSPDASRAEGAEDAGHAGSSLRRLPPAVVYVGAAATALAVGFTVWSAIDTQHARNTFDGTQAALDSGLSREHRTNIGIGVAGGLGALTLLGVLVFVDWHGGSTPAPASDGPRSPGDGPKTPEAAPEASAGVPTVSFGVGPGSLLLRGSF